MVLSFALALSGVLLLLALVGVIRLNLLRQVFGRRIAMALPAVIAFTLIAIAYVFALTLNHARLDEMQTLAAIGWVLLMLGFCYSIWTGYLSERKLGRVRQKLENALVRAQQEVAEKSARLEEKTTELLRVYERNESFSTSQFQELSRITQNFNQIDLTSQCFDSEIRACFDVFCHSEGIAGMSGDMYRFALTDNGGLTFVVGDVMGHSAESAVIAAMAHSALASIDQLAPVSYAADRLHDVLVAMSLEGYMTAVIGRLTPNGHVEIAHCGHPLARIIRADGRIECPFSATAPPLAMFDWQSLDAKTDCAELHQGDALVLFSDVFLEADAAQGSADKGTLRFQSWLEALPRQIGAEDVVFRLTERLYDQMGSRGLQDDLTMACVRLRQVLPDSEAEPEERRRWSRRAIDSHAALYPSL